MNSIIEESRVAKKRGMLGLFKNKKIIIAIILVIIIGGVSAYAATRSKTDTSVVAPKEATAKKGDIKIAVESSGKVVAEDGVELSFSVSGDTLEVSDVYVKEGDKVKRGDKIASVKSDSLQFELRNAYSSYQSALANFQIKQAGATDSEREKGKIALEQAKINLDKTKSDAVQQIANAESSLASAENNLKYNKDVDSSEIVKDAYDDLKSSIKSLSPTLKNYLNDSDSILGIDETYLNDEFEAMIGAKNFSYLNSAKDSYTLAKRDWNALDLTILSFNSATSYASLDSAAVQATQALEEMEKHLYNMQLVLEASITGADLSQTELNSFKSKISSNRSSASSAASGLNSKVQAVRNSKTSLANLEITYKKLQSDLAATKAQTVRDIANSESSLKQAQTAYDELIAPVKEIDLASARAQLTSAAINVDKANYNVRQATLTSPIDGEISSLGYKKGDIINKSDAKPMASIINNNTLFIEVNIEESDINKIKVGDKAYATFDAVDGLDLEGQVSFISLISSTDNNGIVTYLVRVVFENPEGSPVREGMTAALDFVTAEVKNVLMIPVDAVKNINGKPSVQKITGEWNPVTTGFTDGKSVEIISGLAEGDKITY